MRLLVIFLCLIALSSSACLAQVVPEGCNRFEIEAVEFDERVLSSLQTKITDFNVGRLFYLESPGVCVPTTDSYLVAVVYDAMPRIVALLDGHTVTLDIISTDSIPYLGAYYHAGGNQYMLSIFEIRSEGLAPIESPGLASNIKSIEVAGSVIMVRNQVTNVAGDRSIEVDKYQIVDEKVVAIKEDQE